VLVVADEMTLRIRGERGLPRAAEPEEQRRGVTVETPFFISPAYSVPRDDELLVLETKVNAVAGTRDVTAAGC
jgi:hypothetical protein